MDERIHRQSRRHPTRQSRCRHLVQRMSSPDVLLRWTRELPADAVGQIRSDYTIPCPASREWLLARSQSITEFRVRSWPS